LLTRSPFRWFASNYFGGAFPLTFHSHISDITPYRITAAILDLIRMCPEEQGKAIGLSKKQRETCAFAVLDGSYGGSFGPLVSKLQLFFPSFTYLQAN
jgi:hypothetical protein